MEVERDAARLAVVVGREVVTVDQHRPEIDAARLVDHAEAASAARVVMPTERGDDVGRRDLGTSAALDVGRSAREPITARRVRSGLSSGQHPVVAEQHDAFVSGLAGIAAARSRASTGSPRTVVVRLMRPSIRVGAAVHGRFRDLARLDSCREVAAEQLAGPGISRSSPASMAATLRVPNQSDTTTPSNPHSSRRMLGEQLVVLAAERPPTRLYAAITAQTPARRTAASNGTR